MKLETVWSFTRLFGYDPSLIRIEFFALGVKTLLTANMTGGDFGFILHLGLRKHSLALKIFLNG